jgi:hypothetical protein
MTNFQPYTVLKASDLNAAIDAKLSLSGGTVTGPVTVNGPVVVGSGGPLTLPMWTTGARPPGAQGLFGFNTTTLKAELYNGTAWVDPSPAASGTLLAANNLSDLTDFNAARSNLGLGAAATKTTSSGSSPTVASVTGSFTAGHVAVFADANGTLQDGGAPSGSTAGALLAANNLSDVPNAATARNNLGLGSAAIKAASGTGGTVASTTGTFAQGHVLVAADTAGTVQDGGALGSAAMKAASGSGSVVASVSGTTTAGHIATFADTAGTVQDGGTLGTAAGKNASGSGPTLASVTGTITSGHIAVFADTTGTLQDGGAPGTGGASGALLIANNLSDLANASTARNNLGLGSAAVKTASGSGGTVASITGTVTSGHMAIFADASGTLQDGGLPGSGGSAGGTRTVGGTTDTLTSTDNGGVVFYTNTSPVTVTIPSTLTTGFLCTLIQQNIGQVTVAAGTGVTLQSDTNDTTSSSFTTARQGAWLGIAIAPGGVADVAGHTVKGEQTTLYQLPAVTSPATSDKLAGTFSGADGEATISSILALGSAALHTLPTASSPATTDKIAGTFGGVDSEATVSSILALTPASSSASGVGKNFLTNGRFYFNQRGTSSWTAAAALGSPNITLDRWSYFAGANGARTISWIPLADSDRTGIGDESAEGCIQYNITAVGTASTDGEYFGQAIEDVRLLSGKTVTFSFWAYASAASTIAFEAVQNFGTGGSPSATVTGIGAQQIHLVNAWQRYTVTTTIPSAVGRTTGTNGDSCTQVGVWLSAGSNYASRASNIGLQSGFFVSFWGVQLEIGSTASALEMQILAYDLERCQRYLVPYGPVYVFGNAPSSGTDCVVTISFPVQLRAVPQISAPTAGSSPGPTNVSSYTTYNVTQRSFQVSAISTSTGYTFAAINQGTASAELPII